MRTLLIIACFFSNFALAIGEGIALCREIAAQIDQRVAYLEAQELFPEDPIGRAFHISRQYGATAVPFEGYWRSAPTVHQGRRTFAPETYFWLIPKTVSGEHPSIWAYPDMALNTVRYASPSDLWWHGEVVERSNGERYKKFNLLPRKRSKLIVNWSHGLTGLISNSGRVFSQLKVMNAAKPEGTIHKALLADGHWIDTTTVAADLPFHGAGPQDPRYASLEGSLAWRKRYFQSLLEHKGPPQGLIGASRSGESLYLAQLAHENPGLFKGQIWMSPMHPVAGFTDTIQGYNRQNIESKMDPNPHALRWFANTCEEIYRLPAERRWWDSERGVPDLPILILVGEKDPEVPQSTRSKYKALAEKNPDTFFYVEVPGAGHDVFSVTENWTGKGQAWSATAEQSSIGAWKYVYWFLDTKVEKNSTRPPPELGWLHR